MKKKQLIIKITLWWGIVADAFEGIRMFFPTFFLDSTGMNLVADNGLSFGLMYGAPVMLGWSFVLFWAQRKPVERKGIFYCLIPVILGYLMINLIQINNGLVPLEKIIPVMIMQSLLLSLSIISIALAKKIEKSY